MLSHFHINQCVICYFRQLPLVTANIDPRLLSISLQTKRSSRTFVMMISGGMEVT